MTSDFWKFKLPVRAGLVVATVAATVCSCAGGNRREPEEVEPEEKPVESRCRIAPAGALMSRGDGPYVVTPSARGFWVAESIASELRVSRISDANASDPDLARVRHADGPIVPLAAHEVGNDLIVVATSPDLRRPYFFRVEPNGQLTELRSTTRIGEIGRRISAVVTADGEAGLLWLQVSGHDELWRGTITGSEISFAETSTRPGTELLPEISEQTGEPWIRYPDENGATTVRPLRAESTYSGVTYNPNTIVDRLDHFRALGTNIVVWTEFSRDGSYQLAAALPADPAQLASERMIRFSPLPSAPIELETYESDEGRFVAYRSQDVPFAVNLIRLGATNEDAGDAQVLMARAETLNVLSRGTGLLMASRRGLAAGASLYLGDMHCEPLDAAETAGRRR